MRQKEAKHKTLYEFSMYSKEAMPILINNVKLLKNRIPKDIQNPILLFLLPHAFDGVTEKLIFEVVQSWKLLNEILKNLGKDELNNEDKDFGDLLKIRHKLAAHFIDVLLSEERDKYLKWYREKYGSYEKILDLIQRIADKITSRIEELEAEGQFIIENGSVRLSKVIEEKDIERLLEALKEKRIY